MPNQLQTKGAQPSHPTRYAPLYTSTMSAGIWTQRSPIGNSIPQLEAEYYGSKNDTLIDGLNAEVSARLTFVRRPGSSIYNSQTFPAIDRFYENRTSQFNTAQTSSTENIQVIADTASVVYDATGPSTKTALFTKTAGSGKTSFQAVGNSLYFSDGPDQKKYLTPIRAWAAAETFTIGDYIVDTNGNIQSFQSQASNFNITNIEATTFNITGTEGNFSQLFLIVTVDSDIPVIPSNTFISFNGLTVNPVLNGQSLLYQYIPDSWMLNLNPDQVAIRYSGSGFGSAPETGTITLSLEQDLLGNTVTGVTGSSPPTWSTTPFTTTQDGSFNTGITWTNYGLPTQNWGIAAPILAPQVDFGPGTFYWVPNFNTGSFTGRSLALLDSNNNLEVFLGNFGSFLTGKKPPVWSTVDNGFTFENSKQVTWLNYGQIGSWAPSVTLPLAPAVLDSNGNLEVGTGGFITGASVPVWNTTRLGTTADGGGTWVNVGSGTQLTIGSYQYAYSYHSVDGSVSTASPVTIQSGSIIGASSGYNQIITVQGSTDPQVDQIWIWRTTQDESTLLFLDEIPNPGTASSVVYIDTLPDTSLDSQIEAPIADLNNAPPPGITALTYHLERVWGAVGTSVYYSQGPDVTAGNGNTAWSPSSVFVFPSSVTRLYASVNGLFVFTVSDVYLIAGLGTSSSSFYSTPFYPYLGLVSYDAFSVNGSTLYMYTSDNQVVSMDLNSGLSEIGFPIGDQFGPNNGTQTFTPSSTYVTWHIAGSPDKGLYVSDSVGTWWRLSPTPSPETGLTWSPKAQIVGGFSAVQSVETTPGTRNLLLGPESSGPILKRDSSVFTDNGSAYNTFFTLGSIVLAQPGQLASVVFFTTDSIAIGTPLSLAVQLDEIYTNGALTSVSIGSSSGIGYTLNEGVSISGGVGGIAQVTSRSFTGQVTGLRLLNKGSQYPAVGTNVGTTPLGSGVGLTVDFTANVFESLTDHVPDPTELEPSTSLYSQRFYISQTQQPSVCRNLQLQVNWGEDTVQNELLSMTVYGGFEAEL